GGIRSIAAAQRAWNAGVREVILGTRAVDDPGFVARLLDAEAGRVIIGIDALDGRVATRGWVDTGEVLALDLARRVANLGCRRIIYTDISTDGMLTGPNIEAVTALARHVPEVDVIASGGISCLEDVRRLLDVEVPNVAGAITGRALYDGRLDLAQAMRLIAGG
ncbi:1-(5-phosphoribosyl)-5-((5-phosphoribosylamino)methylideneamino)imidazole-4-carboxamide isomerase, partial [Candidatus Poribacteria bacterium]|nr:1-(5-phosphoribosyl)-5-((5-phosphoribosylamino)methylideneamino)imidazole-4-carboxamide isomerase [Candidatus Poribacteria bacterium]